LNQKYIVFAQKAIISEEENKNDYSTVDKNFGKYVPFVDQD
jgi:hypothetical protein